MQDKVGALQLLLSGADMVSMSGTLLMVHVKFFGSQRALAILQQTIEDAFSGKRQFLCGEHGYFNLSFVLVIHMAPN